MATIIKTVNQILNNGGSLTTAINYLYSCDFEDDEVIRFFTKNFGCSEDGIRFELQTIFGISA